MSHPIFTKLMVLLDSDTTEDWNHNGPTYIGAGLNSNYHMSDTRFVHSVFQGKSNAMACHLCIEFTGYLRFLQLKSPQFPVHISLARDGF